jgi:hypothetical protein
VKFRRKPIVVDATLMPSGSWFVRTPWSDQVLTEEQFRREHEETNPAASNGCSCSVDTQREILPNDPSLAHAPACPLSSY